MPSEPLNRHHDAPSYFRMSEHAARLSPVEIIKAAHCYAYQACEHREWEGSKAAKRLQCVIDEATRKLPGYDDAAWGLHDIDLSGPDPISLMSLV